MMLDREKDGRIGYAVPAHPERRVGSGAVPPQGIDPDALRRTLDEHQPETGHREAYCSCGEPIGNWGWGWYDHLTDTILALVRPVEKPDTENFEIGMVTGGHEVTITVTYPRGHAMFGLYALHGANEPERMTSVMAILKDDPSVAARIAELGLAIDDEDDE